MKEICRIIFFIGAGTVIIVGSKAQESYYRGILPIFDNYCYYFNCYDEAVLGPKLHRAEGHMRREFGRGRERAISTPLYGRRGEISRGRTRQSRQALRYGGEKNISRGRGQNPGYGRRREISKDRTNRPRSASSYGGEGEIPRDKIDQPQGNSPEEEVDGEHLSSMVPLIERLLSEASQIPPIPASKKCSDDVRTTGQTAVQTGATRSPERVKSGDGLEYHPGCEPLGRDLKGEDIDGLFTNCLPSLRSTIVNGALAVSNDKLHRGPFFANMLDGKKLNPREQRFLAMVFTSFGETRGLGELGFEAQKDRYQRVMRVLDNRLEEAKGRSEMTVMDVALRRWQFSCYNPGDPNLAAIINYKDNPAREESMKNAVRAFVEYEREGRKVEGMPENTWHFLTHRLYNDKEDVPDWATTPPAKPVQGINDPHHTYLAGISFHVTKGPWGETERDAQKDIPLWGRYLQRAKEKMARVRRGTLAFIGEKLL